MANKPRTVTWDATSTSATTPEYVSFPTACDSAYAQFANVTTSTKASVTLKASIGGSGEWFSVSALTTLTTGAAVIGSTATGVLFDKVKIQVKSKTTNTGTISAFVIAK